MSAYDSFLKRIVPASVIVAETELAVGVVLVNVLTVAAGFSYLVALRNSSATQNIRVGNAPAFGAPNVGFLLAPKDALILDNVAASLNAIADAAAGTLSVIIFRTA